MPARFPHAALQPDQVVYNGQALGAAGITADNWGGGSATDSQTRSITPGAHAIRIASYGLYQGGQITFKNAVALGSPDPSAGRYLQFLIYFADPIDEASLPTALTGRFQLAQSQSPARWLPPQNPGEVGWLPPVSNLRFLFTLDDGTKYEVLRPVLGIGYDNTMDLSAYWFPISIPVSALKVGGRTAAVKSVTVSADGNGIFYIGRIQTVVDHTPITSSAGTPMDVSAGETVVFHAAADAGAGTLHYSWDFDSTDGIAEDGNGPVVQHLFLRGGRTYTVTLTVSDIDGLRPSSVSTVYVKVEE